ncbi:winged helix-turn-helix domain-containing protein [Allosphingosinicella deserti]|uniref:winged helix-turn-helix domain-containing protein n=1 Tax=Allosphingosinicella deserti TaxID=2116704 RepID=UPI001304D827|nr:winged helix-turn-helix domain-containing protein [Sphingomonas deserti]
MSKPGPSTAVDLAHVAPFRLGGLIVDPSTREVRRDDGQRQTIEPRMMQVLAVLARAEGTVVSRDDLVDQCWEGRVVGDSAVNRIILLLRRLGTDIGEGAFHIDTVARVGYRLVGAGGRPAPSADAILAPQPAPSDESPTAGASAARFTRRHMLAGGLTVLAAGGGAYTLWRTRGNPVTQPVSQEAQALIDQARVIGQQATAEGTNQAIGMLRRAVQLAPGSAEAWGSLAHNYAIASQHWSPAMETQMRVRAEGAIERARQIDPGNSSAVAAEAMLLPRMGAELRTEQVLRKGLAANPGSPVLLLNLAWTMLNVGRCKEAADLIMLASSDGRPSPNRLYAQVVMLWAAGRLEEAEQAMKSAFELFSSHYAVWFTRLYLFMYTGRSAEALAQNANEEGRPNGVTPDNFTMLEVTARAFQSRSPGQIVEAIQVNHALAKTGTGYCENSIQFAAALGQVDEAFKLAHAYYFGRGFQVADVRFAGDHRVFSQRKNRRLHILFLPSTEAMRRDLRFERLVQELPLGRYWRQSGSVPDYRRG